MAAKRHPDTLSRKDTLLLVIDVQERLAPAMSEPEFFESNVIRLLEAAEILGLPAIVTEQYPKGLGPTVENVAEVIGDGAIRMEKIAFSALADEKISEAVRATGKGTLLICGIEAHVCVLQTALDALSQGYAVQVAHDAVSSRSPLNRANALERMAAAGATVTSTESALFEMLGKAGTPEFKAISRLVK